MIIEFNNLPYNGGQYEIANIKNINPCSGLDEAMIRLTISFLDAVNKYCETNHDNLITDLEQLTKWYYNL